MLAGKSLFHGSDPLVEGGNGLRRWFCKAGARGEKTEDRRAKDGKVS